VALDSGPSPTPPFMLGGVILHRKVGTATFNLTIPAPGKLVLTGHGLEKSTRTLDRGGKIKMPVRAGWHQGTPLARPVRSRAR
jgi:hypothetical protein